jgi:hypothetical protein
MARLPNQLAALATMSPAQLREAWTEAYEAPAPALSPELLRLGIGYRLQEQKLGGLPKAMISRLLAARGNAPSVAPPTPTLQPGTQLVREWNGRNILVTVTEDGFVFEGKSYASLSGIAKLVTGAHWSGPRFFGIRARA